MNLRVASLFSGVGTFDHGFQKAGWESVHLCEWDPKARQVLAARFPSVPLTNDVTELSGSEMAPADCIMFGSPCQDLSVAGKRFGMRVEGYDGYKTAMAEEARLVVMNPADLTEEESHWLLTFREMKTRSGLFYEAIRIIEEMRGHTGDAFPRFALWENVPGAFSSNGGRDFAEVVRSFLLIGARDVSWRVLDSQFFGVPQRRRRIFLVADFGGERAQEVLFEPKGLQGHPVPRRSPGQVAPACAADRTGSRGQSGLSGGEALVKCLTTGTGKRYDAETETLIPMLATATGLASTLTGMQNGQGTGLGSPRGDGTDNLVVQPVAFDWMASVARDPMVGPVSPTLEGQSKSAVAFALRGHEDGAQAEVSADGNVSALRAAEGGSSRDYVAQPIDARIIAFDCKSSMAGGGSDLAPTLRAMNHDKSHISGGGHVAIAQAVAVDIRNSALDDVSMALQAGGIGADRGMSINSVPHVLQPAPAAYAVRRLTPTECERLQSMPNVVKHAIIDVCPAYPHLKNGPIFTTSANVEISKAKKPSSAGNAGSAKSSQPAPSAELSSAQKLPSDSKPVPLFVRINSEENQLEISFQGKSFLFASSVVSSTQNRLPVPVESFAQLCAGIAITAEQIISSGKAESQVSVPHLTAHLNGERLEELFGDEITRLVNNAESDTLTIKKLTKPTISSLSSILSLELNLTTLFYYAVTATTGHIPLRTLLESGFRLEIESKVGWTDVNGMADSHRYRFMGNGGTSLVLEWIGKRMASVIQRA